MNHLSRERKENENVVSQYLTYFVEFIGLLRDREKASVLALVGVLVIYWFDLYLHYVNLFFIFYIDSVFFV